VELSLHNSPLDPLSFRPHPSSVLLGKVYSSDVTGDGPYPYLPDHPWGSLLFNFQLFGARKASRIFLQFANDSLVTYFPKRLDEYFLVGNSYLYTILLYCGRLDILDSARRLFIHGVHTLDAIDLHLLAGRSMEDLLYTWKRTIRFSQQQDRIWNQYLSFMDRYFWWRMLAAGACFAVLAP
jgi:hypothetical protein